MPIPRRCNVCKIGVMNIRRWTEDRDRSVCSNPEEGPDIWRMFEDEHNLYTQSLVTGQTVLTIKDNGNVGIGTASPGEKLEVNGGVRLNTATAKPGCDANHRGTLWFFQGAAGVKDTLEVCAKAADDTYAWRPIY